MARSLISLRATDQAGNIQPSASVLLLNEDGSTFGQVIYTASSGGTVLTNPLTTDDDGLIEAYVSTPQRAIARTTFDGDTLDVPLDLMPSPDTIALGGNIFDVVTYGAVGDGVTDDTVAIDAAIAAAAANFHGGIVRFPAGGYIYSGAGISNNPPAGVNRSLLLQGDGVGSTNLRFTNVAAISTPCIYLTSQSAIASQGNYGNGVMDMDIDCVDAKPVIKFAGLESWRLTGLTVRGGGKSVEISECRYGWMEHCYIWDWTDTGITITGQTYAPNLYHDIKLVGRLAVATGWAFDYSGTGTADAGGIALREVSCSVSGAGAFRFSNSVLRNMFIFMERCIVDTANCPGPALLMKNVQYALVEDSWFANFTTSAQPSVELDGVSYYSHNGGFVYGGFTGAPAFNFKNTCSNVSLSGVRVWGVAGSVAYKTDGTTHTNVRIDNPPPNSGVTWSNDYTKLVLNDAALTTANFALSAGWGDGAAVSAVTGDDSVMQFTITAGSASFGANPTLTITLPTAVRPRAPIALAQLVAGNVVPTSLGIVTTLTQIQLAFGITPAAGNTLTYALMAR